VDPRIIALYDEYTHAPLPRRTFLERLAVIAGGAAAASALLPMLENNYARAATVEPGDARIVAGMADIKVPSGTMRAYVATPKDGPAKRGGVVVVHENRGLNPHIEDVARRLAVDNFIAFAPDALFPLGGYPGDEDKAREMFGRLDEAKTRADLLAAAHYLKGVPGGNGKVGAVGFCWGGGMVNALATAQPKLSAAVPFYGDVPPSADVPKIKARMLMHYAGNDRRVNAGIPAYEAALKAAGVDYRYYVYDGAEHAFNNDTTAARYNEAAAKLAWERTIEFFRATLG